MKWKKLIIIGDSNTQFGYSNNGCWVSLLSDFLQRKCDVINRGFSGYTTTHIRKILPEILEEFDSESTCGIIILLGTNDSATNDIQNVPLEKYSENLKSILSYLTDSWNFKKENIIIVCPGRIDHVKWAEIKQKSSEIGTHFDSLVANYAEECEKVAIENNISYLNLYKLMLEKGEDYKELFHDGLHFSTIGGELFFQHLKPIIEEKISNKLKPNYPYWKDLTN